jgi:hypothetical protein
MTQASALISGTIKVGMSRADVIARVGTPHRTEAIGGTEFLFHNTAWYMALTASSHSPVAITDDKVAGIGRSYYETFRKTANTATSP